MAKSIIITGAGSGIGEAVARCFLDAGWAVGVLGRRADRLERTADSHANARIIVCDVADIVAVERSFQHFTAACGHLDVLFNNAGVFTPTGTIDEIPYSDWQQTLDVNLTGSFNCARAAFAEMRAQSPMGGRIINNGSISAQSPRPGSAPYTATKHAINGLTKSLSLDGRAFDISCGQIDIGNAATEMVAKVATGAAQADGSVAPEPTMDVNDVARAVLQMAELPASANVQHMTLMATKAPLIGRG